LTSFDETRAQSAFDRLVGALSLESLLADVVLPFLRELGEGWERGEITVAQEHFASNVLRGRLLGLGRGWGRGGGRHALLAAPPGEQHDLGLVVLGLALRDRGWRVTFLGADTPIETIADTARRVAPDVIVIATLVPPEAAPRAAVRELARERRVVVSGAGVSAELAGEVGAEHFGGDPLEAAGYLAGVGGA
jgi:methanogenic corrinoid protein MtbC1